HGSCAPSGSSALGSICDEGGTIASAEGAAKAPRVVERRAPGVRSSAMASPRRPPRASAPPWRWGLALIALGVLVYARAFSAGWMWDDDANVTACAPVLAANGLSTIWLDPHAIQQYYPLVHTTFWIEHRLWGLAPFGYH